MPRKINLTKFVEAGVDKVYKQISDFENYSTYIPGCSSSKLLEKNDEYEIGELEFNFLLKNYNDSLAGAELTIPLHNER